MTGAFAPLAHGERVTSGEGGATWQPRLAHVFAGARPLLHRAPLAHQALQRARRDELTHLERGTWGLALLTRLEVLDVQVVSLGRLPREKVQRAFIVAHLDTTDRAVLRARRARRTPQSRLLSPVPPDQRLSPRRSTRQRRLLIGGDFNSLASAAARPLTWMAVARLGSHVARPAPSLADRSRLWPRPVARTRQLHPRRRAATISPSSPTSSSIRSTPSPRSRVVE